MRPRSDSMPPAGWIPRQAGGGDGRHPTGGRPPPGGVNGGGPPDKGHPLPQDVSAPPARGCLPLAGGRSAPPPDGVLPQAGGQSRGGEGLPAFPPPADRMLLQAGGNPTPSGATRRKGGGSQKPPPANGPSEAVVVDAPAVCGKAARAAHRGMAGVQWSTTAVSPLPTGRDAARSGWGLCCAAAAAAAATTRGSPLCRRAHADASRHCGGVGASPNDKLSATASVRVRVVGRGGAGG